MKFATGDALKQNNLITGKKAVSDRRFEVEPKKPGGGGGGKKLVRARCIDAKYFAIHVKMRALELVLFCFERFFSTLGFYVDGLISER